MPDPGTMVSAVRPWESRSALVLLWALALAAGFRESVLSAAGILAAALVVQGLMRHRRNWRAQPGWTELRAVALALGVYFALHAVRLQGASGLPRLDGPVRAVLMAPLLFLPWLVGLDWRDLRRLVAACGVVLGLCAVLAIGLYPELPRTYGFFTYHNLAAYAAVALVGILACTREEPGQALISRAALVLCVAAVLATGTVGAMLGLPVVAAVAALRWMRRRAQARAEAVGAPRTPLGATFFSRSVGAMALVLVAVLVLATPRLQERAAFFLENLQSQPNENGFYGSGMQRWAMWQVSWAMIQDRPLSGQGLDAFPSQMQPWADRLGLPVRFGIEGFGHGGYQNPHNLILGWAATLGVPTAAGLVGMFWGVPLWAGRRLKRKAQSEPAAAQAHEAWTALWVLLGLLALFCLTESVIERQRGITWFLCWMALILGSLAVTVQARDSDSVRRSA